MKSTKSVATICILVCLCVCVVALPSLAATNPLNSPQGLAVDAKGNLWVANSNSSNILEYNPNYVQQTKATITNGISGPTGIAFDVFGNLWVANFGASNGGALGSVSAYASGSLNEFASFTTGIQDPLALAIDGLGDIWVSNQGSSVTVYQFTYPYIYSTAYMTSFIPGTPIYGIGFSAGSLVWASGSQATLTAAEVELLSSPISVVVPGNNSAISVASAANGNVYMGNLDNSVTVYAPATNTTSLLVQLNFVPSGIAVDNTRGRVYVSNNAANTISVYSTAGALLHTIQ